MARVTNNRLDCLDSEWISWKISLDDWMTLSDPFLKEMILLWHFVKDVNNWSVVSASLVVFLSWWFPKYKHSWWMWIFSKMLAFLTHAQWGMRCASRYQNLHLSMEFEMLRPWKTSYGTWSNISRQPRSRKVNKFLWKVYTWLAMLNFGGKLARMMMLVLVGPLLILGRNWRRSCVSNSFVSTYRGKCEL